MVWLIGSDQRVDQGFGSDSERCRRLSREHEQLLSIDHKRDGRTLLVFVGWS
jgi:hypothetical protein